MDQQFCFVNGRTFSSRTYNFVYYSFFSTDFFFIFIFIRPLGCCFFVCALRVAMNGYEYLNMFSAYIDTKVLFFIIWIPKDSIFFSVCFVNFFYCLFIIFHIFIKSKYGKTKILLYHYYACRNIDVFSKFLIRSA